MLSIEIAYIVVLLFALISCSAAQLYKGDLYTDGHNGRPGCQLPIEFNVKWPNNNDNLRYWLCTPQGAVSYICPTEFLFSYERQCCVHWNYWTWAAPFNPPTLA